jgi:hypothetical protein
MGARRLRAAIARQPRLPSENITPADFARLEAQARRQLDRSRQQIEAGETGPKPPARRKPGRGQGWQKPR